MRQQLIAARALIQNPENWTQKYSARTSTNQPTDPHNENACKFCALGALMKVGANSPEVYRALRPTPGSSLIDFNDSHTHEEVLALFDKAIQNAN